MRFALRAGMKMGGRSGRLCRGSETGLGLCHSEDAGYAMGTDLVSGHPDENHSTRNQQLTEAFSKESPNEARLTRRDENGQQVSRALRFLRDRAGACAIATTPGAKWGQTSVPGAPTGTVRRGINNLRRHSRKRPRFGRRDRSTRNQQLTGGIFRNRAGRRECSAYESDRSSHAHPGIGRSEAPPSWGALTLRPRYPGTIETRCRGSPQQPS